MARRKQNMTRHEIIKVAAQFFLEKGYSHTSPKMICDELDMSTGNLTYYFPSKEDLLAVLTQILCEFQRKQINDEVNEGNSSVIAVCLEMAIMAAMAAQDEVAKDLFVSIYLSSLCLEIVRKNDTERAKLVFNDYCPDWSDEQFAEAEVLVSGVEYATLMTTDDSLPLKVRISGAINNILTIFCVPEEIRKAKIARVLAMDYEKIAKRVLKDFKAFVEEATEEGLYNGYEKIDA
ncbi:MAG: TetR/AcrR family transcriptional regulator [Clostridia bacterium]|nr:TetR/AcrR family transcriptional regulator [Clostridia bacterium]